MKTVYRYEINKTINRVYLPEDSQVIKIDTCFDEIGSEVVNMWAFIDTEKKTICRKFLTVETGTDMSTVIKCKMEHVGSTQKCNGREYHVFELSDLDEND